MTFFHDSNVLSSFSKTLFQSHMLTPEMESLVQKADIPGSRKNISPLRQSNGDNINQDTQYHIYVPKMTQWPLPASVKACVIQAKFIENISNDVSGEVLLISVFAYWRGTSNGTVLLQDSLSITKSF